jgi:CII-binding regulator of phage lambda lysogenization HflD
MSGNGETNAVEVMGIEEKLDVILEALSELSEKVDEINERLQNFNLMGDDYGVDLFEES